MELVVSPEEKAKHTEYAAKALELYPKMLLSIEDPTKEFKKNLYEASFRAYEEEHKEAMGAIEDAFLTADSKEEFVNKLASELVAKAKEQMETKNKRQVENLLLNYNLSLVVYVNPALTDCNKESGKPLVDELLRQWKETFPKTDLKWADFETINGGFKRRYCYITTAVCESLGKQDDCYELNLLREYRDDYLQTLTDGDDLIKKYYDIAPTIVKHINKQNECKEIYQDIWKSYLSPCISFIEKDEKEACKELYREMVDTLAEKYFS